MKSKAGKNRKAKAARAATDKHKASDNDKAIAAAVEKAKDKKVKAKKKRVTIDSVTMELLRKPGGMSLSTIIKELTKQVPDHDADVLKHTTKRRLNGYLKQKFGVKIKKDDNGKYSIAA